MYVSVAFVPVMYQWVNFDALNICDLPVCDFILRLFSMGDNGVILTLILHKGFNFVSITNMF
jgi:hypothetical protein